MREDHPSSKNQGTLPLVSSGTIQRFSASSPDFEILYRHLRFTNSKVADWLLIEVEALAPADAHEKYKYAIIALQLYGMLADQLDNDFVYDRLHSSFEKTPKAQRRVISTKVAPKTLSGADDDA